MFCFSLIAEAEVKPRSAGIGFRGTFWRFNNEKPGFAVSHSPCHTEVNVGGGGGWLYLFSRIDNDWIFEFSLGAVGKAEVKESFYYGERNILFQVYFGNLQFFVWNIDGISVKNSKLLESIGSKVMQYLFYK